MEIGKGGRKCKSCGWPQVFRVQRSEELIKQHEKHSLDLSPFLAALVRVVVRPKFVVHVEPWWSAIFIIASDSADCCCWPAAAIGDEKRGSLLFTKYVMNGKTFFVARSFIQYKLMPSTEQAFFMPGPPFFSSVSGSSSEIRPLDVRVRTLTLSFQSFEVAAAQTISGQRS